MITDLHIHSRFSRACSKNLDLPNIVAWCQLKGIDIVSTADFTHPSWFAELHEKLEETSEGLYQLKKEFVNKTDITIPKKCQRPVRFICSTEISLIYKKGEKCRKVHLVVLAPNLQTVAKINIELEKRGNIHSDGRPILGMPSEDLLELLLNISPDIEMIPAHIWTPHFAIFGSKSGFDSVEECFGNLSLHIHALETGLSSDPLMNWQLLQNDKYVLVSSSDAHSPQKLGREATIFDTEASYPAILRALRSEHEKISTIEFFPEEGKYHADGLRAENLCLMPEETKKNNFVSPQTGKAITVGVLHRVNDLADRKYKEKPKNANAYYYIVPLVEILSEILNVGPNSKKVQTRYFELLHELGSEFEILKNVPISDIAKCDEVLAEGIEKMRDGDVIVEPGYDGEFGVVKLFLANEVRDREQGSLF
jgi:DNA helicase II / ATP-dependent DNA helicase PcrA